MLDLGITVRRIAGPGVGLDEPQHALRRFGPEFQHAAELANRGGVVLLAQQAVRRQDVRGVVLWIGGDDLAERRLRAAAITGTKSLPRVAHPLLDFRRLR